MEELIIGKANNRKSNNSLPLYIAGGDEVQEFAKNYSVIAVDGCSSNVCPAKKIIESFCNTDKCLGYGKSTLAEE